MGYIAHYASYSPQALSGYAEKYTVLALTGYTVDAYGRITIENDALHRRFIREYLNHFLPVLTLKSSSDGISLLTDPAKRDSFARMVSTFCTRHQLSRIQLDFEYLPSPYNHAYAALLKRIKTHNNSLFLSICIAPQVDSLPQYAGFFDVTALDPYADEFMLMSYDYHGPDKKFGPVTDTVWTEKNIRHILKHTESSKLVLGIPLYGYYWDAEGNTRVMTERTFYDRFDRGEIIRSHHGTVTVKKASKRGYPYLSVGDAHTVVLFMSIARRYNLKGCAVWRLGFER
ncbi:MAG: glycosyl hydrolase family 18 protein [Spirochaetota bacterium]